MRQTWPSWSGQDSSSQIWRHWGSHDRCLCLEAGSRLEGCRAWLGLESCMWPRMQLTGSSALEGALQGQEELEHRAWARVRTLLSVKATRQGASWLGEGNCLGSFGLSLVRPRKQSLSPLSHGSHAGASHCPAAGLHGGHTCWKPHASHHMGCCYDAKGIRSEAAAEARGWCRHPYCTLHEPRHWVFF